MDVVTTAGGDMFRAMHELLSLGHKTFTAADVLQLATHGGAQALGLPDVGSLAVGNKEDLVLLRATDLNLAAAHDPIAAVVTSAHPGNGDTVLVGGTPVKRDGHLTTPSHPTALTASATYLAAQVRGLDR
ncbi:amidohydrolase family protein [Kribbella solani]|uniref:amidohydrolase family protein n=1 Tax=Kribbella solani TaxID=236067 RepID=UPI0029B0D369|nr:amidohydrolase family protein [Kribbella solani]MDX2970895.1 amidohydrolase family protein [Kribbella solani]